jgi:hypothetical protein
VPGKRSDSVPFGWVRVTVCPADNNDVKAVHVLAAGRQHSGGEPISLAVAECQEQGHFALNMVIEADVPLDIWDRGRGHVALCCFFALAAKIFRDGVLHEFRFLLRLGLGLDSKPNFSSRSIANEFHGLDGTPKGASTAIADGSD